MSGDERFRALSRVSFSHYLLISPRAPQPVIIVYYFAMRCTNLRSEQQLNADRLGVISDLNKTSTTEDNTDLTITYS